MCSKFKHLIFGNNFNQLNSAISGQYYMQEGTGENITIPAQYQADYDQGYGAGSDQTQ